MNDPVIGHGGHGGSEGACIAEWVSLIHAGQARVAVDGLPTLAEHTLWDQANTVKTDTPDCTNLVVTYVAQRCNDRLDDSERDEFGRRFLARILRARRLPDAETERRVNVRLAIWCARRVAHLWPDELKALCEEALAAAEGTLTGAVTRDEAGLAADRLHKARMEWWTAANAAANAASAIAANAASAIAANAASAIAADATAADAASTATDAASSAAANAANANAADATAADALVDLFDDLLDQHLKEVAEEGAYSDLLDLWEHDACVFAESFDG